MKQGTYIGLRATTATKKFLQKRYGALGVRDTIPDPHITLMYDTHNDKVSEYQPDPTRVFKAIVTGASVMGEPGSKYRAIALHLSCPELQRKHYALRRAFSFQHSYDKYKCHVSIKYRPNEIDEQIVLDDHQIIGKQLTFSQEYVEPLELKD
jgi:hypothetical protein